MTVQIEDALAHPRDRIVVLLDEARVCNESEGKGLYLMYPFLFLPVSHFQVNTTNSMGLFKEIVCDHSLNGRAIPGNLKIIAACNPYRLKKKSSKVQSLWVEHFCLSLRDGVMSAFRSKLWRTKWLV